MASERPQSIIGAPTTASSKPPVTLAPSAHLDPGAYVRGSNPITLGSNTLTHPRAHLLSTHAPLMIGDGCIVGEKAVVGGPPPIATPAEQKDNVAVGSDDGELKKATVIEDKVRLDPHAQVHHSATIFEGAVIESHAVVLPGAVIGKHSKICGGVTIREGMNVPEHIVVWGSGEQRRRRQREDVAVEGRLKAMDKEREAATAILRNAAVKASQARREKGR